MGMSINVPIDCEAKIAVLCPEVDPAAPPDRNPIRCGHFWAIVCSLENELQSVPSAVSQLFCSFDFDSSLDGVGWKMEVQSLQNGSAAVITFHTKAFYSRKSQKMTAETIEFTYSGGRVEVMDIAQIERGTRFIRLIHKQLRLEFRVVWKKLVDLLQCGNVEQADIA
uniref:MATH domain-containing protein n=1 Tax=Trichuris muris TaxID=70415 RepID=A0A5S6Q6G4_TRIMR